MAASKTPQTQMPSSTSTWHVGMSPPFPPSLVLSNNAAIESLVTDIPFLSVGLLGFGVLTFFFAMRNFNRLAFYVFASVIVAFIGGVLDVGQVLIRGGVAAESDTDASQVLPLLVARELSLSMSVGIRFLFFWIFVLQPPRGDHGLLSRVDSQDYKPSFLWLGSDIHSVRRVRWGYVDGPLKYGLLLAVLIIPILQILWRVVADFSRIGPVYNADSSLEIAISALFVIKLFVNVWLSPLTPRWKTIRDYLPIFFALFIGLGIGVGNILCFQFSETSLGRFLQAIELYIMVLYVLIASFYTQKSRVSMLGSIMRDRASKASQAPKGIETRDRMSAFEVNLITTSASGDMPGDITSRPRTLYSRPDNLPSWLVPDADQTPVAPDAPRRVSTEDKLFSRLTSRRNPAKHDTHSRLWAKEDIESVTPTVDIKTGFATLPETQEVASWKDLLNTSVVPTLAGRRLERMRTLDSPASGTRKDIVSPDGTIASFAGIGNYSKDDFIPPQVPKLPGSPVYGLDGIVRYHGQSSPVSRPSSVRSLGMESLLRQQAELDKSVAELQLFSGSRASVSSGMEMSVPGGQAESLPSDISLSNFPEPPLDALRRPADVGTMDVSKASRQHFTGSQQADATVMFPLSVIARPPRLSSLNAQSRRQQSFPSASPRLSKDSAMLSVANRTIIGSGGTQYDVTSFIGDLTTPALESFSQPDVLRRPISLVIDQSVAEDAQAARVGQVADVTPVITVQARAPPLATIAEGEADSLPESSAPRWTEQGLPSRIRLNISKPILKASDERSTAFERPRPAPPA